MTCRALAFVCSGTEINTIQIGGRDQSRKRLRPTGLGRRRNCVIGQTAVRRLPPEL